MLGPRLATHTRRGRHMHEESKMASSTGQKTGELYYEKQVFDILDGLKLQIPLDQTFLEKGH